MRLVAIHLRSYLLAGRWLLQIVDCKCSNLVRNVAQVAEDNTIQIVAAKRI